MLTSDDGDENGELSTPDELDDEVRAKLSDLEDDPANFTPIYEAREVLDDQGAKLPSELEARSESTSRKAEDVRNRIAEWRETLEKLEDRVEEALRVEMERNELLDERRELEKEAADRVGSELDKREDGHPTAVSDERLTEIAGERDHLSNRIKDLNDRLEGFRDMHRGRFAGQPDNLLAIMADPDRYRPWIAENILPEVERWTDRYDLLVEKCEEVGAQCPFSGPSSMETAINRWRRKQE